MTSDYITKHFPNFGKNWFENPYGEITVPGSGHNARKYQAEVRRYRKYKYRLKSQAPPQVEKPPIFKQTLPQIEKPPILKEQDASTQNSSFPRSAKMPKPTKRSRAWKKQGGRKRRSRPNKALSGHRVPFKTVISVDSKHGETESGLYFNELKIKNLAPAMMAIYEEFKCVSLKVRFIPNDITTGAGVYAAVLLDQTGFGAPSAGTATWFPRVADLPGARICHITRGFVFRWKPTEPDSRNYQKVVGSQTDYAVATLYMFAKDDKTRLHGELLLTGCLIARGEYYSANLTDRLKALHLQDLAGSVHSQDDNDSVSSTSSAVVVPAESRRDATS